MSVITTVPVTKEDFKRRVANIRIPKKTTTDPTAFMKMFEHDFSTYTEQGLVWLAVLKYRRLVLLFRMMSKNPNSVPVFFDHNLPISRYLNAETCPLCFVWNRGWVSRVKFVPLHKTCLLRSTRWLACTGECTNEFNSMAKALRWAALRSSTREDTYEAFENAANLAFGIFKKIEGAYITRYCTPTDGGSI